MKFAILGSGGVGGYYGARLARAGHDVTFIARGAHLAAIRERGLEVRSPALGDFVVQRAPRKTIRRRSARWTGGLCRQGLRQRDGAADDRADARSGDGDPDAAERRGQRRGARGVVRRVGRDRRDDLHRDVDRCARRDRADRHASADRVRRGLRRSAAAVGARASDSTRRWPAPTSRSEAVEDGRVPIWEKFIFLVSLAGFTGAARLPIGPLWADEQIRAQFLDGVPGDRAGGARRGRAGCRRHRRADRRLRRRTFPAPCDRRC